MTFYAYCTGPFGRDLARVIAALPSLHGDPDGEVVIQPRTISLENQLIRAWTIEHRYRFAAALFFMVLVDQACYTYYKDHYRAFRELTMYPKWRGDCPGACGYHIDPTVVFRAIGMPPGQFRSLIALRENMFPRDLWPTMQQAVAEFFREKLPDVDGTSFWLRCWREVPVALKIVSGAFGRAGE